MWIVNSDLGYHLDITDPLVALVDLFDHLVGFGPHDLVSEGLILSHAHIEVLLEMLQVLLLYLC